MPATSIRPRDSFVSLAKAIALGAGQRSQPKAVAENFRDPSVVEFLQKSGVGAGATTAGAWGADLYVPGRAEFLNQLRQTTVIGKFGTGGIPSLNLVPLATRVLAELGTGAASWVGQGAAIPIGSQSWNAVRLDPAKIASIVALSEELLFSASPNSESAIRAAMVAVVARSENRLFLHPSSAPGSDYPGSILYGATSLPSSGDPIADVHALIALEAPDQSLEDAVLVMSPTTAVAVLANHPTLNATLGVRGGTFLGLPVVTSPGIDDNLALVHASAIIVGDDGEVALDASKNATLEMSAAPSGDSVTPSAANVVSMFETDSVALRVIRTLNWARGREDAVRYISDADYGFGS